MPPAGKSAALLRMKMPDERRRLQHRGVNMDNALYKYSPIVDRPKLVWPARA